MNHITISQFSSGEKCCTWKVTCNKWEGRKSNFYRSKLHTNILLVGLPCRGPSFNSLQKGVPLTLWGSFNITAGPKRMKGSLTFCIPWCLATHPAASIQPDTNQISFGKVYPQPWQGFEMPNNHFDVHDLHPVCITKHQCIISRM